MRTRRWPLFVSESSGSLPTRVNSKLNCLLHNRVFDHSNLVDFERVQIINLCPATAEEAKALIPRCVEGGSPVVQLQAIRGRLS